MLVALDEPSVENSRLSPQFVFYDPAMVYARTNMSLEYVRCQDFICDKTAMHICLDDAVVQEAVTVQPVNLQSIVITSVVNLQLCLICLWLSNRWSKRSDFISKYVTTPYLSTVKMTPTTRSWLRILMAGSVFCALICVLSWVFYALEFIIQLTKLLFPLFIPPTLAVVSWLLLRKARAEKLSTSKSVLLIVLWMFAILGVIWSLHRLFVIEFPDCSQVTLAGLQTVIMVGGVVEIVSAFMWIFLVNSIRLALMNTKPECANLLGGYNGRWMAPQVNRNWVNNITIGSGRYEDYCSPQRFQKQEHTRRMKRSGS